MKLITVKKQNQTGRNLGYETPTFVFHCHEKINDVKHAIICNWHKQVAGQLVEREDPLSCHEFNFCCLVFIFF